MICKMFTINGKAPVISNIALTGSAIADPSVILEYSAISNTPYYDGFSVRCPGVKNPNINYSDMCYYSTVKYDNPSLSQLTKAEFIPMSDMTAESHYLATTRSYVGGVTGRDGRLWFPRDTYWEHAGAYWIPTASYQNGPLYVYIWLPDIMNAPDNADEAGLDCTTLQTNSETCVNIYKCNMSSALSNFSFNQTYCKEIVNFDAPSGDQYFGYGSLIPTSTSGLNYIELISASKLMQYQELPAIKSAYKSTIHGAKNIEYAEDCTIQNTQASYFPTTIDSAKNCNLTNVDYKSANSCTAEYNADAAFGTDLNSSAYNSTVNFNNLPTNNRKYYFENCNIPMTPSWPHSARFSAVNSNVTGELSPAVFNNIGTYVNTYYHSTADNSDWYMENFPTVPATPL